MRMWLSAVAIIVMMLSAAPAPAVEPDELLADPKLESRARAISAELRCLVCQNQSIDDSNAPLARDLRILVRERLKVGDSDQQVIQYVVDRYGKFVLLKPPFDAQTLLLWLTPLLVLAGAGLVILRGVQRSGPERPAAGVPLTPAEEGRLRALLQTEESRAPETAPKK
jgi:cytochrome c-type biogenesis protein CcmH